MLKNGEKEMQTKPKIGIGVATYNRLPLLKKCVASITKTMPKEASLVIASDGSTDKTDRWLAEEGHTHITGENVGVARNKNRLLANLDHCDYIFLIEDDITIKDPNCFSYYIDASHQADIHHFSYHNNARRSRRNNRLILNGVSIIFSKGTTGQLMFFTQQALQKCGGFNPTYMGHGYEHLELSKRINFAFNQSRGFADCNEGNLCIDAPPTPSSTAVTGSNKAKYKFFKKRYKKNFDRFCFQPYREER